MGTYTTNYNLFMPTVGEQGWGELVNGNFTTIDTTMAGLNTRVGTLETETDAIEERVTASEERIATLEDDSGYVYVDLTTVSNSTIGSYNVVVDNSSVTTNNGSVNTGTYSTPNITVNDISCNLKKGFKHDGELSVLISASVSVNSHGSNANWRIYIYVNDSLVASQTSFSNTSTPSYSSTISVKKGDVIKASIYKPFSGTNFFNYTLSLTSLTGDLYLA